MQDFLFTILFFITIFISLLVFVLRKIFKINELLYSQQVIARLLIGIADKLNVDEYYFPEEKETGNNSK